MGTLSNFINKQFLEHDVWYAAGIMGLFAFSIGLAFPLMASLLMVLTLELQKRTCQHVSAA